MKNRQRKERENPNPNKLLRHRRYSTTRFVVNDQHRLMETNSDGEGSRSPKTLDDFLEESFQSSIFQGRFRQWPYWCILLSCGVANSSDASEILCLSYILIDEQFEKQILGESQWKGGLLATAVFMGMLVGGLVIGTLGDWVGRRPILLLGLTCNAIAGILSALATNVWMMSFLRFTAGVGIGATVPPMFTLVTELAPPSKRGFCVTLCASFWMVGSIYVAVVALATFEWWETSWRLFALASAFPSVIGALLCYSLVPESPRFLALSHQYDAAVATANWLARKMNSTLDYELTVADLEATFPVGTHERTSSLPSLATTNGRLVMIRKAFLDFTRSASKLYTPQLRPITLPLQMVWFSLSFGSYGLLTWINTLFREVHLKNVYFNALLFAASNLPGNLLSAYLMDRIARGKLLTWNVIASATSLITFAASAFSVSTFGIVVSACLFQCFSVASWNTTDCMTTELFPTSVRSSGVGICAASGRIGAMVAQIVNSALVAQPVRLLLVASITLLLGALTPRLLPEGGNMTGQPVQDVTSDVETIPFMQDSNTIV